jgi:hypothetical protein
MKEFSSRPTVPINALQNTAKTLVQRWKRNREPYLVGTPKEPRD